MTPARRIGVVCTGAVALAVLVGVVVALTRDPGTVDRQWHDCLRSYALAHPGWLTTWDVITQLGATSTVLVVDTALVVVCCVRRQPVLAAFVVVVGFGGWGLRILLRNQIDRARPADPLWTADGPSFPSGHTTNGTLMALLVAIVCWSLAKTAAARAGVVSAAVAVALAVGFSRVAGGVHWPTDVVGGWALAVAWLSVVAALFPWSRTSGRPSPHGG